MFVGIDIGGSFIRGVLTDKSGKELSFKEIETPKTAREIDESIYNIVEVLATSATISKIDIKAIGIGSAGSIDREKGVIIKSRNIGGFENHPLVKNIEKLTGVRVLLENDATIALIGAWWKGNGSKFRNWIMLTLGTGIGGGVIIDNRIYTGQTGNSMEVGHMTIDMNGKECSCGNRGCWELYAAGSALAELAEERIRAGKGSTLHERLNEEKLTPMMVYEEALNKDQLAMSIFDEYCLYLGVGIANLVNIFSPEAIIFGGGLSQAHRTLIPAVRKIVKERALKGLKEHVQFFPIKDHRIIPALGAAKIAIDSAVD